MLSLWLNNSFLYFSVSSGVRLARSQTNIVVWSLKLCRMTLAVTTRKENHTLEVHGVATHSCSSSANYNTGQLLCHGNRRYRILFQCLHSFNYRCTCIATRPPNSLDMQSFALPVELSLISQLHLCILFSQSHLCILFVPLHADTSSGTDHKMQPMPVESL